MSEPTDPHQAPPPPPDLLAKPKKKRRWPWVVGVLVLLVSALAVFSSDGDGKDVSNSGEGSVSSQEKRTTPPGIGDRVRDGKFEFVVEGVDSGLPEVGEGLLATTAQGQFVVVRVTVTNIGDKPQSFMPSDQYLYNAQGQKFSTSTDAEIAVSGDAAILTNINPGNTVHTSLPFDVPPGMAATEIELHDSAFSNGVKVVFPKDLPRPAQPTEDTQSSSQEDGETDTGDVDSTDQEPDSAPHPGG